MRFLHLVGAALLCCSTFGCKYFYSEKEADIVAKVGESVLLEEDIPLFSEQNNALDSVSHRKSFIENWVKQKLLLAKALENLTENQASFEEQLENYRNSLLTYTFENQVVNQKLDTTIEQKELLKYYRENAQNFKLREDIVKGVFVAALNNAPNSDSMAFWVGSNFNYYKEDLKSYCSQFSIACNLDTAVWFPLAKIKEIAKLQADKKLNIKIGKNTIQDSVKTVEMHVFATMLKGETAPFTWVKSELEQIILNKRKIELIARVKREIFEAATLNKEYEIYD